jgi:hypothetical protein
LPVTLCVREQTVCVCVSESELLCASVRCGEVRLR